MMKMLLALLITASLAIPASASEFTAPEVPISALERMPENTASFGEGLLELLENSIRLLHPDLEEAVQVCGCVFSAVLLCSLLPLVTKGSHTVTSVAAALIIASVMFQHTQSMVHLASDVVRELCEYEKLLCPVLTAALAAQGGAATSSALYLGTMAFMTLLGMLIYKCLVPMVYVYLVFSIANCAIGEEILRKIADGVKNCASWLLKTLLIVFTTYMSITGIVSGTTDAAALKAAKVTISTVVPVVGSILSDVSDSVLISMGVMKNAAGIYGILAALAVCVGPFLKVGVHYLLLKATAALCSILGNKQVTALVSDFSAALGLLLAMIGTGCTLILISTVCFLKGAG